MLIILGTRHNWKINLDCHQIYVKRALSFSVSELIEKEIVSHYGLNEPVNDPNDYYNIFLC